MKKIIISLIINLSLMACGKKEEATTANNNRYYSVNTVSQSAIIDTAISNINKYTIVRLQPGSDSNAKLNISFNETINNVTWLGVTSCTISTTTNCSITLKNTNTDINIVYHEIGHALGLSHSSDPRDVMYAYDNSNLIDSESMSRFYTAISLANQ